MNKKPPARKAHSLPKKHNVKFMDKVKIKRKPRKKKNATAGEKSLAALGLGMTLMGGAGVAAPKTPQTQFVSAQKQESGQKASKIKQKLQEIFGIPEAKADIYSNNALSGSPDQQDWTNFSGAPATNVSANTDVGDTLTAMPANDQSNDAGNYGGT
ncbi:MAG TPA: hypothetical protein VHA30_04840, partial [Patescibacteria group bacterium]|nr:hypothetical protein [Patescibacteria group bacterium]